MFEINTSGRRKICILCKLEQPKHVWCWCACYHDNTLVFFSRFFPQYIQFSTSLPIELQKQPRNLKTLVVLWGRIRVFHPKFESQTRFSRQQKMLSVFSDFYRFKLLCKKKKENDVAGMAYVMCLFVVSTDFLQFGITNKKSSSRKNNCKRPKQQQRRP